MVEIRKVYEAVQDAKELLESRGNVVLTKQTFDDLIQMSDELAKLRAAKPAPGVQSFLDASTVHITKKDNEILARWAEMEPEDSGQAAPYRTIAHAYGFFVHVRQEPATERRSVIRDALKFDISDAFLALQNHARKHGCWWINLDRDADVIPGLRQHDWSKPE